MPSKYFSTIWGVSLNNKALGHVWGILFSELFILHTSHVINLRNSNHSSKKQLTFWMMRIFSGFIWPYLIFNILICACISSPHVKYRRSFTSSHACAFIMKHFVNAFFIYTETRKFIVGNFTAHKCAPRIRRKEYCITTLQLLRIRDMFHQILLPRAKLV